jgi:hypothetical protein
VEHPRFAYESLQLPIKAVGAPPLFLELGGTIKGRLLTPDGQPAADVPIYPGGADFSARDRDYRTASDGTFQFSSLRAGDFNLQKLDFGGRDKALPFIVRSKQVKALKAGETRDIGDWKTETGILVKGKVVESGAKTPVPYASISLSQAQSQSDKNGDFSFRAPDDVSHGFISAQGFFNVHKQLAQAVGGVLDMGTIELRRGLVAKGTLKDKNGQHVVKMQIHAESERNGRVYGHTDSKGNFSIAPLEPGNYTLNVHGRKLLSGATFSVAAGQTTAPIEAVVDTQVDTKMDTGAPKILAGHALDAKGNAVGGAKISLRVSSENGAQYLTAISGVDGRFETKSALEGAAPTITGASRPGLVFARADEFKIVDGVWRADLFMQPRGIALRGRVVDSEGQPAARAWVSLVGRSDAPIVQSDENGAFSIPDVALQGVTVIASDGRAYGQATVEKAGENATVALSKTADYDAATLAEEILPTARLDRLWGERLTPVWNALGTTRLEAAILRSKSGDGNWEWTWSEYLSHLALHDPASFLARGEELLALTPTNRKEEATARLMLLRARSTDETERAKAQAWVGEQKTVKHEMTAGSIIPLLRVSAVAESLKAGGGAFWLEYAAQIAAQGAEKTRYDGAYQWGEAVAELGVTALEDFTQEWSAASKLRLLGRALPVFTARKDLETSRKILSSMQELEVEANQTAKNVLNLEEGRFMKPKDTIAQARLVVANLLAQTDPQAALELVKGLGTYTQQGGIFLEIGKTAGKLGQNELAASALRQVFESQYGNIEPGVAAARIALDFDPKLADELFQKARDKAKPRGFEHDLRFRPSIAAYAEARAKNWAGESRILIEREWAERIKANKRLEENDFVSDQSLKALVGAMARLDARRALEMADQLPEKRNMRALARGQIAIALLSKDSNIEIFE